MTMRRVDYVCSDRIATITLNRPELLNAFDAAMYEGVNEALIRFRDDESAWVAVIQAAGDRAFSAGADVKALNANADKGITSGLGALISDEQMVTNKPIIAAVQGYCVGEGINLVLACDLVIADVDAQFIISEARIGVNAVDIPLRLAKKMSYAKAFAFLIPGEPKSAEWCHDAGLVEIIAPKGQVQEMANRYARRIVEECGPLAVRAQKETLWLGVFRSEAEGRAVGVTLKEKIRRSKDYAEGRAAFTEKRRPRFTGS